MILVFIEHKDCVLNKTSLEAITAAQSIGKDLGLKIAAVLPCDKDCALAQEIAGYSLEKVIVAKHEKLGTYTPDGYADAWEQVIIATNPQYVVMSHTYQVRDFAPKVAARMGRELSNWIGMLRATGFLAAMLVLSACTPGPMLDRTTLNRDGVVQRISVSTPATAQNSGPRCGRTSLHLIGPGGSRLCRRGPGAP